MLDSRKLLLALVVVALAIPAFAQSPNLPLSCTAQAAGTPSIRAEGVTELVGDVLIHCTGGDPTPAGQNVKQVNIQIFTQPGINITSRVQSAVSGQTGNFTEALLFIDEPVPDLQTICGATVFPYSIPVGSSQSLVSGVCGAVSGSPGGNGVGTYNPNTAITLEGTSRGNTFQARQATATSLIWQGIPFDPPGSLTTREIRITNVRVNASQLGVPAGSTQTVQLQISTSASGVSNPIALPITNPSPTVAIAQKSLDFSLSTSPVKCLQCEDANGSFAKDPTKALGSKLDCDGSQTTMRFTELFPSAFRRRNIALPEPPLTGTVAPSVQIRQDSLGTIYQTESGFYKAASNSPFWPANFTNSGASAGNASLIAGQSSGTLGLADHGTRLIARFANIQNGVQVWVSPVGTVKNIQSAGGTTTTGQAVLTNSDVNGAGPFSPVNVAGTIYSQVNIIGGTGQAVFEILNTDTTALERVEIPVVFAWVSNTTNGLPAIGTSTMNGNLAPISTIATASATAPIPRFVDTPISKSLLTINTCKSNLLFPFVTNVGGFDTGLAIANTTKDPWGTPLQTGACTVNFYGYVGNSKVCLSYPSPSITGGEHFVWSLANGGAVTATAGFQGYVIAECNFQYAHGYAFISDLGAQKFAQGYLALVMDDSIGTRTGSVSETLGH